MQGFLVGRQMPICLEMKLNAIDYIENFWSSDNSVYSTKNQPRWKADAAYSRQLPHYHIHQDYFPSTDILWIHDIWIRMGSLNLFTRLQYNASRGIKVAQSV